MLKKIFTNSAGILLSRILGFLRDLLTASILGANIYSDIFFVAFKLPNLFRRIFGEGAFVQSFLPSYTASTNKALFAAAVFQRFFLIIFSLSIIVTIFSPFFTKLIAFGFSEHLIDMAAPYVAINFYYLDFIFCVTFLAALLQHKEHFATTAFSTALLNLSLIIALILFQQAPKETIVLAMSIAVLIGGALQFILHVYMSYRLHIFNRLLTGFFALRKKRDLINKQLQHFYKNFFPAIWGNSTAQISAFLDTWLASFLSTGSISYLYYANRILQLPLALFAIATATALFPSIAKSLKHNEEQKALKLLEQSFFALFALLLFATIGGILLAKEIIWLLFERGSFTHSDTVATASVLAMYMLGLLPYGLAKLFSLWLYATHRQKEAAKIASYSLITNIIFSLLLIIPLKAAGLALASSIAGFVLCFYSIKAFGFTKFIHIAKNRKLLWLLFAAAIEIAIILLIKEFWRINANI
ncbi:putative peptidoglycan lipid II flippase [Nitratiruptor sp. YY08-26]|uniref:murein biosynthesis integral membrane protein MurJ n=1 Tax=unclassified Nitratiruptor TaxID=2624044 RepID=UPI001915A2EC|nr:MULTISPECIES: murein biosynthesis integral membrane protein MurJ [unclassified Nitratiruptor]BCD62476.1 putative peptidoglycan lipid II flippase [Nitratiruptor sp. YY08-13]BCD66412.1 putative peptidoglycan lipid II flippase [Nitratiruptor sp. YY08-26]